SRRDRHTIAGAQWFATTYEDYLYHVYNTENTYLTDHPIYRRTLGSETPEVPMFTLANLLNDFDFVYVNEPQPYRQWIAAHTEEVRTTLSNYFDDYVNPIESVCLVLPEGRGDFAIQFENHYGYHVPYWYVVDINGDVVSADSIVPSEWSQDIMEDVQMTVDGYTINVTPRSAQSVSSGHYLSVDIHVQTQNTGDYGSTLGYLSFRQSAPLSPDAIGWRESEHIPIVVANVHDGDASENPLYFDMIIFNSADATGNSDVVNRVKFQWGADENLTQDLGTFFMMQPYNSIEGTPTYGLETRITNRTGTRYRLERYSTVNDPTLTADSGVNNNYHEIYPDYWTYDLTPDRYGSLPSSFMLDNHSQIAPGLVTVYRNKVGPGYSTIDTNYGTSASYRLYPFSSGVSHNLTLKYKRVAGMIAGNWSSVLSGRTQVRPFTLNRNTSSGQSPFVDNPEDSSKSTEREFETLTGYPPVLAQVDNIANLDLGLSSPYINADALNAIEIFATVPEGLVSMDTVTSKDEEGNLISVDIPAETAILPLVVRFRLPRDEQLTEAQWQALDTAEDVLAAFRKLGTIWVRSENTMYKDANLLRAISNRLSEAKVSVSGSQSDIVRAFTYSDPSYSTTKGRDSLCLEFLVYLADAKSPHEGYTGFIDLIEDDNIPYLVIGDGAADGKWSLSFYISLDGPDPNDNDGDNTAETQTSSGGGGGGCDTGALGVLAMILAGGAFLLRRRMC
ncbi:MAG: hypothetical protein IJU98_00825, partial [Synergistaceae bacterium]|nr:hypothetical protein [Synergistaceae bacterium]